MCKQSVCNPREFGKCRLGVATGRFQREMTGNDGK